MNSFLVARCFGCGVKSAFHEIDRSFRGDLGDLVINAARRGDELLILTEPISIGESCRCVPGQPTPRQHAEAAEQGARAVAEYGQVKYVRDSA